MRISSRSKRGRYVTIGQSLLYTFAGVYALVNYFGFIPHGNSSTGFPAWVMGGAGVLLIFIGLGILTAMLITRPAEPQE
jgi:hypothetical protein